MATDYFLKIDGIEGESYDDYHKDEIELLSWSWGQSNSGANGGAAGKTQMQDFSFVMFISKASPKLFLACAEGKPLRSATLTCRKAGASKSEYLKIKMSDVLISSFQTSAGGDNSIPAEHISLAFGRIEYEYAPIKSDGTLGTKMVAGWDLQKSARI